MNIEVKNSIKAIDYNESMKILEKRVSDVYQENKKELLWILEHNSVYTAGTSSNEDDLLDKTGAEDNLGKKVSKDADLNKITYPGLIGIQQCKSELDKCTQNAIEHISKAQLLIKNDNLENLKLLAKWNVERDH